MNGMLPNMSYSLDYSPNGKSIVFLSKSSVYLFRHRRASKLVLKISCKHFQKGPRLLFRVPLLLVVAFSIVKRGAFLLQTINVCAMFNYFLLMESVAIIIVIFITVLSYLLNIASIRTFHFPCEKHYLTIHSHGVLLSTSTGTLEMFLGLPRDAYTRSFISTISGSTCSFLMRRMENIMFL